MNKLKWPKGQEEQGMVQWWEHSPPTNVAQLQIPASTPYVGWVCCWFSPLLREVFFPCTPVFPSPQKPILPNSNLIWNEQTRLNKFIWTAMCFMGKQAIYNFCCCFYKEQNTWYGRRFELLRITLGSTSVLKKKNKISTRRSSQRCLTLHSHLIY